MAAKKQSEKKTDQGPKAQPRPKAAPGPGNQPTEPPQPPPAPELETTGDKVKRVAKAALKKIAAAAIDAIEAQPGARKNISKGAGQKKAPAEGTAKPTPSREEPAKTEKPSARKKAPEAKPGKTGKAAPSREEPPAPARGRRRTAHASQASAAEEPAQTRPQQPAPQPSICPTPAPEPAPAPAASNLPTAGEPPLPPNPRGAHVPIGPEVTPAPAEPQQGPAPLGREEPEYDQQRSRLVLMVRDPEWLFAYWTITARDREQHRIGLPQGAPPLLLRIFDLGDTTESHALGENYFDITVIDDARGWYIHLPHSGGHWQAALGYLDERGEFVTLCRSNTVHVPSLAMVMASGIEGEPWGPMMEEIGEMGFLPTGEMAPLERGATEERPNHQARAWTELTRGGASERLMRPGASEQFLRPGASEQVPLRPGASEQRLRPGASEQLLRPGASERLAMPGSQMWPEQRGAQEVPRGFWLQVYTELIVYGATEPDAKVTVQGIPVRLRPDGTFTLRFALPEGEQVIPVRAVKVDDSEERTITPVVVRSTR